MSDYRIDVKVRNNRLLEAIEADGFKNVSQFCEKFGFCQTRIGKFINLKLAPMMDCGNWSPLAIRVADSLNRECDDLWDDDQRWMSLESNKTERKISKESFQHLLTERQRYDDPSVLLEELELEDVVKDALSTIPKRYSEILSETYGINGGEEKTLEKIGERFDISRDRVRQIKENGLRKLRNPHNVHARDLRDFAGVKK